MRGLEILIHSPYGLTNYGEAIQRRSHLVGIGYQLIHVETGDAIPDGRGLLQDVVNPLRIPVNIARHNGTISFLAL